VATDQFVRNHGCAVLPLVAVDLEVWILQDTIVADAHIFQHKGGCKLLTVGFEASCLPRFICPVAAPCVTVCAQSLHALSTVPQELSASDAFVAEVHSDCSLIPKKECC